MKRRFVKSFFMLSVFLHANTPPYSSVMPQQLQPNRFLISPQNAAQHLYVVATDYRDGKGVKMDFIKAFNLYLLAAEQNYPPAQYQVGMMFRHGIGIQQNSDYAKYWLKKAAQNRYSMAIAIYNAFYAKKPSCPPQYYAQYRP